DAAGLAGLVGIGFLVYTTTEYSAFLFRGGLVLLSVATAALVVAVSHPDSRLAWVLSGRLLQWIGVRSYGIYLWHVPVIVLTTPLHAERASTPVVVGQIAATFAFAALSWRYVEDPIRGGALGRLWQQLRRHEWRLSVLPTRAWAASAGVLAGVAVIAFAASGVASPAARAGVSSAPPISVSFTGSPAPVGDRRAALGAPMSSCTAVVHIGDSTSEGLISPTYLSNPSQRIEAQYARVGAATQRFEISGARSIVETLAGQTNAADLARQIVAQGFSGCWVIALGDNDTANVHAGSIVPLAPRIDKMMSIIGNQPVLWVNAKTLLTNGDYSDADMQLWNRALVDACPRYPNMRIYDWHSVVQDSWFTDDEVHYTSAGYAQRARLFADALAHAFPAGGPAPACVVR
ncbi:MAG: acyltransferase family protein, partial [Frankiaceae bacterium]